MSFINKFYLSIVSLLNTIFNRLGNYQRNEKFTFLFVVLNHHLHYSNYFNNEFLYSIKLS